MMIKLNIISFLLLCLTSGKAFSQNNNNPFFEFNTISSIYTVPENSVDTAFAKELIITSLDTLLFNHIDIVQSEKNQNEWLQTSVISTSHQQISDSACFSPLCVYRINENKIGVFLGYYALSKIYKINLQLFINNQSTVIWSKEF